MHDSNQREYDAYDSNRPILEDKRRSDDYKEDGTIQTHNGKIENDGSAIDYQDLKQGVAPNDINFSQSAESVKSSATKGDMSLSFEELRHNEKFLENLDQDKAIKERFGPYAELVESLTMPFFFETRHDIVDLIMSNDSTRLVVVESMSDECLHVVQFCTETFKTHFTYVITGFFIKAKEIVQSRSSSKSESLFVLPYLTEEGFHLMLFDKT